MHVFKQAQYIDPRLLVHARCAVLRHYATRRLVDCAWYMQDAQCKEKTRTKLCAGKMLPQRFQQYAAGLPCLANENDYLSIITGSHYTCTHRVAEVAENLKTDFVFNLQGDEPIFPSNELRNFINKANENQNEIYTGIKKIDKEDDYRNLSIPKMVFSNSKKLLYSSRAPIPSNKKNFFNDAYKHVCVYAFNKSHLSLFKNKYYIEYKNLTTGSTTNH